MGQNTVQGKDVVGHWETGEAKLIAKIRIYRIVSERPADPPGKQDTAEPWLVVGHVLTSGESLFLL